MNSVRSFPDCTHYVMMPYTAIVSLSYMDGYIILADGILADIALIEDKLIEKVRLMQIYKTGGRQG